MTKIAYIGPSGVFGGVRCIVEHCNRLTWRGHDVTFLYTSGEPVKWLHCDFEQRPRTDPGTGYDVVVGTAMDTWPMLAALGGRPFGLMQMAEWLFAPVNSEAYHQRRSEFIDTRLEVLAISEWLARQAEAAGHVTHRIRNGIDPALFYPDPFSDAKTKPRVLVEGYSVNPAKDTEEMALRAVRRLRWNLGMDFELWGFSQFPPRAEFDPYWQRPEQDTIRHIYSSCDVLLKASKYEGRPGPDLEAMACGCAVNRAICPGCGDDDLRGGENCLKVDYGDIDAYTENLRRLLTDGDLRARLQAAGRQYVADHADWDGAIDLVEQSLTGSVTRESQAERDAIGADYPLSLYDDMQDVIVRWESGQAWFLGKLLEKEFAPQTVLDVGCGPGIYLVPFKPRAQVLGLDGSEMAGRMLEPEEFIRADFREALPELGRFDLALCIEVAEHLPPARSEWLVDTLTKAAKVVFFSAAAPGQGGTGHINERPREWWLAQFQARGYDLHPRYEAIVESIANNPECQKVRWLLGNTLVLHATNQQ